jgi:hypothetical protein
LGDGARLFVAGTQQLDACDGEARSILYVDHDPPLFAQLQLVGVQVFRGAGRGSRQHRGRTRVPSTDRATDDGYVGFLALQGNSALGCVPDAPLGEVTLQAGDVFRPELWSQECLHLRVQLLKDWIRFQKRIHARKRRPHETLVAEGATKLYCRPRCPRRAIVHSSGYPGTYVPGFDSYRTSLQLKCGFSIMPTMLPNGSFTAATLMPPPTSLTAS